jgi:SNF2 family DNA or RNA helicase
MHIYSSTKQKEAKEAKEAKEKEIAAAKKASFFGSTSSSSSSSSKKEETKKSKKKGDDDEDEPPGYVNGQFLPSTKLAAIVERLKEIQQQGEGLKTVIFSQFTSMLDLVEVPLKQAGWHFGRYDGSVTLTNRERVLEEFRTDPLCNVLLMSLKCGSLGMYLAFIHHSWRIIFSIPPVSHCSLQLCTNRFEFNMCVTCHPH